MPRPLQIQIPTPCHENWQNMTPNDKGKHCMSCQKTVIDFTNMSDRQILAHITNASSSVCGRFNGDQLNKDLVVPENRKRLSWAYLWNLTIASFLAVGKANAQSDPPLVGDTIVNTSGIYGNVSVLRLKSLKGVVVDAFTKLPVPGAN